MMLKLILTDYLLINWCTQFSLYTDDGTQIVSSLLVPPAYGKSFLLIQWYFPTSIWREGIFNPKQTWQKAVWPLARVTNRLKNSSPPHQLLQRINVTDQTCNDYCSSMPSPLKVWWLPFTRYDAPTLSSDSLKKFFLINFEHSIPTC